MILMCILWFIIHIVIHFPLEWMPILCVFYLYFWGKIPQKGAYPLHIPISNDCIYAWRLFGQYKSIIMRCSPSYFISNSEILKIYIILDLYNDPLYFAPLRSLFGNFSLLDIIELHAFNVGQRWEYVCQNYLKSDN